MVFGSKSGQLSKWQKLKKPPKTTKNHQKRPTKPQKTTKKPPKNYQKTTPKASKRSEASPPTPGTPLEGGLGDKEPPGSSQPNGHLASKKLGVQKVGVLCVLVRLGVTLQFLSLRLFNLKKRGSTHWLFGMPLSCPFAV